MKKLFPLLALSMLVFTACEKAAYQEVTAEEDMVIAPTDRKCDADVVLQQQIAADPTLKTRLDEIDAHAAQYAEMKKKGMIPQAVANVVIPVVVNVVYSTAAENISIDRINEQIAILNKDFAGTNTDINLVPSNFTGVKAGNTGISFVLQAVNRQPTTKRSFRTNDDVKKTSKGGLDPTTPTTALNIWVCTLANGILGYAQFPGGAAATDGVVILNSAFGITSGNYNLGRTATHEVGHWANLRHIWGDATCGNDLVDDTPTHNAANYQCPPAGHLSTCAGAPVEMWMNYMDYTYDRCMYMFSAGQRDRMAAAFSVGGGRQSFL